MNFSVVNPEPKIPILANVPHSSCVVPPHIRNHFIINDSELHDQHRHLVDWFTDELYAPLGDAGGCMVKYELRRFVVEPERFEDDLNEIMVTRGMGVIYTHGCQEQRIRRNLTPAEREELLELYYRPYHAYLSSQTDQCLKLFDRYVFIDCHSYPSTALPYELNGSTSRPDIVIGADPFHTPLNLVKAIEKIALDFAYSFGVDQPFAGTVVPNGFYKDPRITAVMLEIKRSTYMDELKLQPTQGFKKIQECIQSVVAAGLVYFRDDWFGWLYGRNNSGSS
jgi:N-formylglutamate amidohydrolase